MLKWLLLKTFSVSVDVCVFFPKVNSQSQYGMTACYFAASGGHSACLEALIRLGADVMIPAFKDLPINGALRKGHGACVDLLLKVCNYRSSKKFREGNVFSPIVSVRQSFCAGGGFLCDHYPRCIGHHHTGINPPPPDLAPAPPIPTFRHRTWDFNVEGHPHRTYSNLFIMKQVWLASVWLASCWNAFLVTTIVTFVKKCQCFQYCKMKSGFVFSFMGL